MTRGTFRPIAVLDWIIWGVLKTKLSVIVFHPYHCIHRTFIDKCQAAVFRFQCSWRGQPKNQRPVGYITIDGRKIEVDYISTFHFAKKDKVLD